MIVLGFAPLLAHAQTNVRAWSAQGQVFVVWEVDASPPITYDVYRSTSPVAAVTQATLVGRVFQPEWQGDRLRLASSGATWRIPSEAGGIYSLTASEGLFVYTPHAAANEYFAVVANGNTQISASNRTATAIPVLYDPRTNPVACHLQLAGTTSRGYPFSVYAMWVDGRDDPADARPDYPVMANAGKNGAPHVFSVFEPTSGLPAGPFPAVLCLHGGGPTGSHWAFAPESFHYANDDATPLVGITVAMDDRLFLSTNGVVNPDRPSNWFGWHPGLDPLSNTVPGNNAVVVPYTLRRLIWTLDWLTTRSPYAIDPDRVSVMGNSMGGAGTLLLSRYRPERFSSATAFVPQHYTPETGQRLFGTTEQNLATTELGPGGVPLRVNDFFDPAVRLSPAQRDFCLTRIFRGRCDEAVEWGPLTIQLFNAMSTARWGTHLYWDHRDHTASDWTSDDARTPCQDIGEWVFPERTERSGAPFQARFRASQSFPGFFGDDQDLTLPGRQPTLGDGAIEDGDPWGTWGGYLDWDTQSVSDTPYSWAATLFLVGQSATSVDNFPGSSATVNVAVRKPQLFCPSEGTALRWSLRRTADGAVLQAGTTTPEADGLVVVSGLTLFKDPTRSRLEIAPSDSTPPKEVRDLKLVREGDDLDLAWQPVLFDVLGGLETMGTYELWRASQPDLSDGAFLAATAGAETSLGVPGEGSPGAGAFFYQLRARDAAGNLGN